MTGRNLRRSFVLSFILLTLFFGMSETNFSQTKIKRNLKDYKEGKSLEDWDSRFGNAEKSGAWDHIDNYLWELWSKKELAYFRVDSYTLEGRQTTIVYYIEKGKNDKWQITEEWDRINNCPYISKKKCNEYRYKTFIYKNIEKITDKDGKINIIFHLLEKK